MFTDPYSPTQTDYQRQQLNMIRRHQGLPPIPPPRRYIDFFETWMIWSWHIFLAWTLFFGIITWFVFNSEGDFEPTLWQGIFWFGAPLVLLVYLRARRAQRLEAEYQDMIRRWKQAGCP